MTGRDLLKIDTLSELRAVLGELRVEERARIATLDLTAGLTDEDRVAMGSDFTQRVIDRTFARLVEDDPYPEPDPPKPFEFNPLELLELLNELEERRVFMELLAEKTGNDDLRLFSPSLSKKTTKLAERMTDLMLALDWHRIDDSIASSKG